MENFFEFIMENMLVLIPVLFFIGEVIKKTPKAPDWIIPHMLIVFGVILAFGIGGLNFDSLIQGILVAGATVLGHQVLKQTKEKD